MAETYTNDGETEYELVYDIPNDAANDHTVWLESDDEKVGVSLSEFRGEWEEYEPNDKTNTFLRERAKNEYGIQ